MTRRPPAPRLAAGALAATVAIALFSFGADSAPAQDGEARVSAMARAGQAKSPRPSALVQARQILDRSADAARDAARQCATASLIGEEARQALLWQRPDEAAAALDALLQIECDTSASTRNLTHFQRAYLAYHQGDHATALTHLDALEGSTPIDDYVSYLRALNLSALERHQEAAQAYERVYEAKDSPMIWRARAAQAEALMAAERYEQAAPVLTQIAEMFPDYPRRHIILYLQGRALEATDRPQDAARSYQLAWFEFPYKEEGELALERLDVLREQGVTIAEIPREDRLKRFRQLRVDKFWPLAHELLTGLLEEHATESGDSAFENEVTLEIALNRYYSHQFEASLPYFEEARRRFEAGNEAGMSKRTLYRFHSFALARLGRFDEAIEALETLYRGEPARELLSALAGFYEQHGRYPEALAAYDRLYSAYRKRGWHYTYLLYKSGKFDEAYENLRRLADRSSGQNRAKYLYWTARTLERSGNDEEAALVFDDVAQAYPTSYYGLQAAGRLLDLRQRAGSDGGFVQAERVVESSDEVFDAFDEASFYGFRQAPGTYQDPRATPLPGALTEEGPVRRTDTGPYYATPCDPEDDGCVSTPSMVAPGVGLTWNPGRPLIAPSQLLGVEPDTSRDEIDDTDRDNIAGLDDRNAPQARVPSGEVDFTRPAGRVRYNAEARIYWGGRNGSDMAFVNYARGEMIGPVPEAITAYDDDTHRGGLARAVEEAGELFPNLERARWLWQAGWTTEARRVIRDVSLEFRGLSRRARAGSSPVELPYRRWGYYIDNRPPRKQAQLWGMESDELRFPVATTTSERRAQIARQQAIFDRRRRLDTVLVHAFQEVGDYHLVRRHALGNTWWLRRAPEGEARRYWMMAYPRAFPEKVIPLAKQHGVNPYMIWALMLVESSFNPDSLSRADALGLLQVIPRTGLKIADLFGDEDFGPYDLLEEDNAIAHGIFYFSRLVRKFHGQELFAFAGYNGGPHRVGAWLEMRGHQIPLDEFIEEIPYAEARGYAKKVLRFVNLYLRIYEDGEPLYVGQNVRQDYLEMPNF
ncbi:tetratricopeptide repeat protein [Lujinxingia vulgaris]|uniref:Tetratricopeptide repeat protein n=1 Tax=Lujinxingia vulgaris TaxID=2600176 RepID=A0A5C6WTB1_9DELT|nr:tetratricopeptide repeat protein [Lujinxingia vulgaris]TXD31667.1 tetratricopeptide repeat protein [Lujinxingia vulgaris]